MTTSVRSSISVIKVPHTAQRHHCRENIDLHTYPSDRIASTDGSQGEKCENMQQQKDLHVVGVGSLLEVCSKQGNENPLLDRSCCRLINLQWSRRHWISMLLTVDQFESMKQIFCFEYMGSLK